MSSGAEPLARQRVLRCRWRRCGSWNVRNALQRISSIHHTPGGPQPVTANGKTSLAMATATFGGIPAPEWHFVMENKWGEINSCTKYVSFFSLLLDALPLRKRDINLTLKSSKLQAKCFVRLFVLPTIFCLALRPSQFLYFPIFTSCTSPATFRLLWQFPLPLCLCFVCSLSFFVPSPLFCSRGLFAVFLPGNLRPERCRFSF